MTIRLDLPELRRALSETAAASADLTPDTGRRYYLGELPTPLLWVIRHPRIAASLLAISRRLTEEERAEIRAAMERKPRMAKRRTKK